jgi:hypothetical protein
LQGDATAPGKIHAPRAGKIGSVEKGAQEREQQNGAATFFHRGFRQGLGIVGKRDGPPEQNASPPLMQRGSGRFSVGSGKWRTPFSNGSLEDPQSDKPPCC